ncbi:MAG: ribonuclease D [Kofleriaceae bacterium]
MPPLVTDPEEVTAVAAAVARARLAAFDLEFLSQDRLIPSLCLVQVAWLDGHDALDEQTGTIVASQLRVVLLDPLAVDVRPVIEALAAHSCVVAHAPRQDLALLAARFGVALPHVLDSQLMAAFAGIGDQVGFASLARELLGIALDKDQQWTDWAARPLSDAQLVYADADVRHLPAIYAQLAKRLGERIEWARAESALVASEAVAATQVTPETAWRNISGLRGLPPIVLATAIELAAWRQRVAMELDRPLGQVLNDKLLIDLARQRPGSSGALRSFRGISPTVRTRADDLIKIIASADASRAPVHLAGRAPSARAQRWAEPLFSIVQLVAERTRLPPRLLATRSDTDEFARVVDEGGLDAAATLPALATWRRDVIGQVWVEWLSGKLALVGDLAAAHGIQLVRGDGVKFVK